MRIHVASVHDRAELQVLARMKADTEAAKRATSKIKIGGPIISQAPHLGWNPFGL